MAELTTCSAGLSSLLQPKRVAVVGASPDHPVRGQVLKNLLDGGPVEVVAVNPRRSEVLGIPCFPDLRSLPWVPDVVVVAVGRENAVGVVEEAAALGIRAGVVFAIGFAESDPHGHALQSRLEEAAQRSGMALLGPNCQGLVNFVDGIPLYMEAVEAYEPGSAALVSQSGSVTTTLTNSQSGVRWAHVVSSGNEAVLTAGDFLEYWVGDAQIRVICAFLEAIRRPGDFFRACDRAHANGKPVIVLKSGRSETSREASVSHSGALSPPDRLVDELFRRHHVLRAESAEELLAMAVCALSGRRWGRRVATVAASGGQIGLALDAVAGSNLRHEEFSKSTSEALRRLLPPVVEVRNPLDYWGVENLGKSFAAIVEILGHDPDVDVVVALESDVRGYPTRYPANSVPSKRESLALVASQVEKPLVVIGGLSGEVPGDAVEGELKRGVIELSGLRVGFRAIHMFANASAQEATIEADEREVDAERVADKLAGLPSTLECSGPATFELLSTIGLTVADSVIVAESRTAVKAATAIGYPVVLKTADADVLHKTDRGLVSTSIEDEAGVRKVFESLRRQGTKRVLVQREVTSGVELLVGLRSDPELGTFVLVGLGGIWTEVLEDVAVRAVGLRKGEALEMLRELRGWRVLLGERGSPHVSLEAVTAAIECIDSFGQTFGQNVAEMDVNPLIATATGAYAVDGLIRWGRRESQFGRARAEVGSESS